MRRVLVTGADGIVGGLVMERLGDRYELVGLTRRPTEGIAFAGDVSDLDAIRPAFEGCDAVVHLAAAAAVDSGWDVVLPANVVGAYNVFQAASEAGVELVVFASTNHVVGMYERDGSPWAEDPNHPMQVDTGVAPRPDSLYGASKAWGEALGRYYSERHGLRVVCLRIGWVTEDGAPPTAKDGSGPNEVERIRRRRGMWLSHGDCARLVGAALDAPAELRFGIVNGVSDNPGRWFSLEEGRELLGWWPEDSEARAG